MRNGEIRTPTSDEIEETVELFKEDHRRELRDSIEQQRRMFEAGAPIHEIAHLADRIKNLEEIVSKFAD